MQRHRHEQVEVDLAPVVGDELPADTVDLADAELGHELDLLLAEQIGQVLGSDRLREAAVERRCEHDFAACADSALAQVPVGEEGELDRRYRALDRHVGDVHDEPAAVEARQRPLERRGSRQVVEGEDALVPARPGHAFGLLGLEPDAARNDEDVVRECGAVVEQYLVAVDRDGLDLVLVEDDPVTQLALTRSHDRLDLRQSERHEEQARLVDVPVVAVDDVDLCLVRVEAVVQPVGGDRATRPAAEDHDLFRCHSVPPWSSTPSPLRRGQQSVPARNGVRTTTQLSSCP